MFFDKITIIPNCQLRNTEYQFGFLIRDNIFYIKIERNIITNSPFEIKYKLLHVDKKTLITYCVCYIVYRENYIYVNFPTIEINQNNEKNETSFVKYELSKNDSIDIEIPNKLRRLVNISSKIRLVKDETSFIHFLILIANHACDTPIFLDYEFKLRSLINLILYTYSEFVKNNIFNEEIKQYDKKDVVFVIEETIKYYENSIKNCHEDNSSYKLLKLEYSKVIDILNKLLTEFTL